MADVMMRDEFEAMLIERAWRDPAFRARLVQDPKKAIEAEFGRKVAAGCEIVVVDESQGKVGIVIPAPPPARSGGALSDGDLQKVAGGGALTFGQDWRSLMTMPFGGKGPHGDYADTWKAGRSDYADTWTMPLGGAGRKLS